jgi:hypothetical protein
MLPENSMASTGNLQQHITSHQSMWTFTWCHLLEATTFASVFCNMVSPNDLPTGYQGKSLQIQIQLCL